MIRLFKNLFLRDRNIMTAILLNAVVITLLYFPQFSRNDWLHLLDHFFILFFLAEAIVKISHFGWYRYLRNSWNRFDLFVVIVSLPSLAMNFIDLPDASFLLILRLVRLVRLVKYIQFIPHMNAIMAGLGRALRASFFVLLALLVLNFIIALFACHFYREIAPEFFGNPLISCYSIFQMFTLEGWNEIPAVIAERSESEVFAGMTRFFFLVVVLVGGLFGMSLANAVFVDEMTIDNNVVLEEKIDRLQEQIGELQQLIKDKK